MEMSEGGREPGDSVLDPTTENFIRSLKGSKPIHQLSPVEARQILEKVQSNQGPSPGVEMRRIDLSTRFGEVSLRIVRPVGQKEQLPGILYVHGGGWVLGSGNTHQRLVGELARGAGAVVVFVNYSLSPEAKFPTALEQCYAAAKAMAEHAREWGIDASRLALVGDSAGGAMATVLARWALERGGPKFLYQVLLYPVTDAAMETESYKTFADGPWLTRAAMEWFWSSYQPDADKRGDPDLSPLRTPLERLKGLPPALIITGENDVLRDEGEAYGRRLTEAGAEAATVRFLGAIHDFMMLNPLAETTVTRDAVELAVAKLHSAFMVH